MILKRKQYIKVPVSYDNLPGADEDHTMPNKRGVREYSKGGSKIVEYDISETVNAIRNNNTEVFKKYLATNETGYFTPRDESGVRTLVPGVFVAGDVADPHYRQAITAAASGCKAALEAERYLAAKV